MRNRLEVILYMLYVPMTMKFCVIAMRIETVHMLDLLVCKEQQIASGNKTYVCS